MFYKKIENKIGLKIVMLLIICLSVCLFGGKTIHAVTLNGDGFEYVIIDELEKTIEITSATDENVANIMKSGSVTIPATIGEYKVIGIGTSAFSTVNLETTLQSVTISEGVEYIGELSFYGLTNLSDVTLPSTLQSIGYGAFWDCTSLKEIKLPTNLRTLDERSFGESGLETITLPTSLETIGSECFANSALKTVSFSENAAPVLAEKAFYDCTNLTSVKLSEGITTISEYCFQSCINLETVELPSTLTAIEKLAFFYCKKLEIIEFPEAVKDFGAGAFWGTAWINAQRNASENGLVIVNNIVVDGRLCSGAIELPSGIERIGEYAFYGSENYLETDSSKMTGASITSITFPDTCTNIALMAFYKCGQLKDITFSDSITTIESKAFDSCISLESVTLPKNLEVLGKKAFVACGELEIIVPDSLPNLEAIHFEDMPDVTLQIEEGGNVYLYLVQNNIVIEYTTYEAPESNDGSSDDTPSNDEQNNNNPNIQTPSTEGEGMQGTNKEEQKTEEPTSGEQAQTPSTTEELRYEIGKTYVVKNLKYTILSTNTVAFAGSTNKKITALTIPAKVKLGDKNYKVVSVSKKACKGYNKLKKLVIGNNVTTISNEAFMNCKLLVSVTIGKNVKSIGKKVFYNDTKLNSVC